MNIGIIDSMTLEERSNSRVITKHRQNRIAKGAGVQARRVDLLLREYRVMADIFAKMQQDQP